MEHRVAENSDNGSSFAALGGEAVSCSTFPTGNTMFLAVTPFQILCACSRPKVIEDVAHQDEVVSTLSKAMQTANVRLVTAWHRPGHDLTSPPQRVAVLACRCPICCSMVHPELVRRQLPLQLGDTCMGVLPWLLRFHGSCRALSWHRHPVLQTKAAPRACLRAQCIR